MIGFILQIAVLALVAMLVIAGAGLSYATWLLIREIKKGSEPR